MLATFLDPITLNGLLSLPAGLVQVPLKVVNSVGQVVAPTNQYPANANLISIYRLNSGSYTAVIDLPSDFTVDEVAGLKASLFLSSEKIVKVEMGGRLFPDPNSPAKRYQLSLKQGKFQTQVTESDGAFELQSLLLDESLFSTNNSMVLTQLNQKQFFNLSNAMTGNLVLSNFRAPVTSFFGKVVLEGICTANSN